MTDFASPSSPATSTPVMRQGGLKRFALCAVVFFSLAAIVGAIIAASLVHTAVALMRDEASPTPTDVFDGRVRLKSHDIVIDENRLAALTRLSNAQ
ncbi:MAG: hypothetical protein JWN07_1903 [Hyphomicrobiales bacterium]|nr:hypothetical protein [Hyphomicrobiales bacterium]